MPPVGFEPTSAGVGPQTYALDGAATGTGINYVYTIKITHKIGGFVYHLLLFFQVRPAVKAKIKAAALCHKKV